MHNPLLRSFSRQEPHERDTRKYTLRCASSVPVERDRRQKVLSLAEQFHLLNELYLHVNKVRHTHLARKPQDELQPHKYEKGASHMPVQE